MNPVSLDDVFAFGAITEESPINTHETHEVKRRSNATVSKSPANDPMLKLIGLPTVVRNTRETNADIKFASLNASLSELNLYMGRLEDNLDKTVSACTINKNSYPVWAIALIAFMTALVVGLVSYFAYNEWKSRS